MNKEDMAEVLTMMKETSNGKGKFSITAKTITLFILVAAFAFGIYGSFEKALFNMDDYVVFLDSFTWFFAPLIVSIGAGTATKVIADAKKKPEEVKNA